MALFVGEFDQTIDAKHRLAIPAALREQLVAADDGTQFYLTLGPDRHLWLYPDKFYRRMIATLQRSPLPTRQRGPLDMLHALSRLIKPDSQGRVVLPEKSLDRSAVAETVTLVGAGDHIEIWPKAEWDAHVEAMLPRYGQDLLDAGDRLAGREAASGEQP